MTAIYNPTLCAALIADIRSAFGRYLDGDGSRALELADQLEAAGAEVARLREEMIGGTAPTLSSCGTGSITEGTPIIAAVTP